MAATTTAFGLDIAADTQLSFLRGTIAKATGRKLTLSVQTVAQGRDSWPDDGELVCDERLPNGKPNFSIERHVNAGYMICGPNYGTHILFERCQPLEMLPRRPA